MGNISAFKADQSEFWTEIHFVGQREWDQNSDMGCPDPESAAYPTPQANKGG